MHNCINTRPIRARFMMTAIRGDPKRKIRLVLTPIKYFPNKWLTKWIGVSNPFYSVYLTFVIEITKVAKSYLVRFPLSRHVGQAVCEQRVF